MVLNSIHSINLENLASKCHNVKYNKKRFPAVIMTKSNPKSTAMIFSSGKIMILGLKSEQDCHLAA